MVPRGHVSRSTRWVLVGMALALAAGSPAMAGMLADFQPEPASASLPEFVWNGQEFFAGAGAVGNGFGVPGAGDGDLPLASQQAPGLTVVTPFIIPGISGGTVNAAANSTTFRNATLLITPKSQAAGSAWTSFGTVTQPLGQTGFEIWSNDPATGSADLAVLLLKGVIQAARITGLDGTNVASVRSSTVTYTGGAILDAAHWTQATGSLSWSLTVGPALGIDPQTNKLIGFTSYAGGQFSGIERIPEPATLSAMLVGGLLLALRRREHRR